MIIKKLEITNFRSYYGYNSLDLTDGLNLIIGANGDGKTTIFDALAWLFNTKQVVMDERLISKKREEELSTSESDDVRVALYYEHEGQDKTLEKMFRFTKSSDGTVTTQNYSFVLREGNGIERTEVSGVNIDHDFPVELRHYTMFRGESDLDVFKESNALGILIKTFSDVKDFNAYFKFMEFAKSSAESARDSAQRKDKKNSDKVRGLKQIIEREDAILSDINREIEDKTDEVTNFKALLDNIEQNREASEQLVDVNRRIANLTKDRDETASHIHEDYTINLLDDMWILMGFTNIAADFTKKVNDADLKRREEEKAYLIEAGEKKALKKLKFTPLPVNIPGPQTMKEMLHDEVCKVCGRPAPKHSGPWEFMLHKLQEYEDAIKNRKDKEDDSVPPLYKNNYIKELMGRATTLDNNLHDINVLRQRIKEKIALNNRLHNDIRKIEENLEREYENKKRILAQTDGLTEEQLQARYQDISSWTNQQRNAEDRVKTLKVQREKHREKLDDAQNQLSQLAVGTSAEIYTKIWNIIRQIADAFKSAKDKNKYDLLKAIEDKANYYLEQLNINDFKGTVRIIEKANGQGEVRLVNNDGATIYSPNTALKTTYLMSIIFAISCISSERKNTEYPLIFDAPTSSFTDAKDTEFFNVISKLNKQVIIVTKSFLKDVGNGNIVLDCDRVEAVQGTVYRIEKKKPFDDKKLGTIQTIITKIK
ncbi:MAG: AAA family ATPase [Prevotella sp.]